jgi:aminopeptidase N
MSFPLSRFAPALILSLTFAASQAAAQPTASAAPRDRFSHANPSEARVTHVSLDLAADFASRTLAGTARLTIERAPAARQLALDTHGLTILGVNGPGEAPLPFVLGDAHPVTGRALTITLPPAGGTLVSTLVVAVRYRTSPDAGALQWLPPALTAGKQHPYLLSQGQAILTRSWIPTQDTPAVRQTYDARITAPAPLRVLMSAEPLTPDGEPDEGGRAFRFRMTQPIPSYLITIAIGDIARRELGPRTAVYAEPAVVDAAAKEFVDLEKMLAAAESLYGPYRWGRYDLLVLPPSFPYGGMENPRLSFLTPTLLAGDRSLVSVVAHELAHSWSGNLVTNATWRDFWLNEGFTSYIELRIMEALYGAEQAAMLESLGRDELDAELRTLGASSPATRLHLDDTASDPDSGLSGIAYTKGSAFLRMLERELGRARLDAYLTGYFDRHAFTSLTTSEFLQDLRTHLLAKDEALERRLLVREWLFEPGLPANAPVVKSAAFERVLAAARAFVEDGDATRVRPDAWSTNEWLKFLGAMPETLPRERLAALDAAFRLSEKTNSEVLFAWLRLAALRQYEPAVPALERFLLGQGRRKFVYPLFEALLKNEWGAPLARRLYERARGTYHPVTVTSVDALMQKGR